MGELVLSATSDDFYAYPGSENWFCVLDMQRQARAAKKELKVMFKDELIKQQRAMATPAPATIPLP